MAYSQGMEESVIVEYFGDQGGRFCDVGANDGCTRSNTKRLAELNWAGICIEPDPFAVCKLIETHRASKNIDILNACIAPQRGITKFHSAFGDGISTTEKHHRDRWLSNGGTYKSIYVPTLTINDVFDLFGHRFEMVNIDTESTNWMVLKQMPLKAMGVKLVCVEHDMQQQEIKRFCSAAGLTKCLLENKENILLCVPK